ncbi:MAG: hypothetical protein RLZ87_1222 [Armatimonadota bacterium]
MVFAVVNLLLNRNLIWPHNLSQFLNLLTLLFNKGRYFLFWSKKLLSYRLCHPIVTLLLVCGLGHRSELLLSNLHFFLGWSIIFLGSYSETSRLSHYFLNAAENLAVTNRLILLLLNIRHRRLVMNHSWRIRGCYIPSTSYIIQISRFIPLYFLCYLNDFSPSIRRLTP